MRSNFTARLCFLGLFSLLLSTANAQNIVAEQTDYNFGWNNSLTNYTDPGDPGNNQYFEAGQTFRSLLTTSITNLDFFVEGFYAAGDVNIEIYSCTGPNSWGSLLGTQTNVSITDNGWVSADLTTLNIQVIAGEYYGFKLIPQDGLQAGIGIQDGDAFPDGGLWWGNGVGGEGFNSGYDAPFSIGGAGILGSGSVSLHAIKQGSTSFLSWVTVGDLKGKNYFIEHSTNNMSWTNIGRVAVNGNISQYSFVHTDPVTGINYYRIRQMDLNGNDLYSEVRLVSFIESAETFELVGSNPVVSGTLQLKLNITTALFFYNIQGKLIWKKELTAGLQNIDISGSSSGIYFLKGGNTTKKISIQ